MCIRDSGITADQVPTLGDQGIIFILNKKSDNRFKDATNSDYGTVGRGGIAPVSYTHLDVYKRQIVKSHHKVFSFLFPLSFCIFILEK